MGRTRRGLRGVFGAAVVAGLLAPGGVAHAETADPVTCATTAAEAGRGSSMPLIYVAPALDPGATKAERDARATEHEQLRDALEDDGFTVTIAVLSKGKTFDGVVAAARSSLGRPAQYVLVVPDHLDSEAEDFRKKEATPGDEPVWPVLITDDTPDAGSIADDYRDQRDALPLPDDATIVAKQANPARTPSDPSSPPRADAKTETTFRLEFAGAKGAAAPEGGALVTESITLFRAGRQVAACSLSGDAPSLPMSLTVGGDHDDLQAVVAGDAAGPGETRRWIVPLSSPSGEPTTGADRPDDDDPAPLGAQAPAASGDARSPLALLLAALVGAAAAAVAVTLLRRPRGVTPDGSGPGFAYAAGPAAGGPPLGGLPPAGGGYGPTAPLPHPPAPGPTPAPAPAFAPVPVRPPAPGWTAAVFGDQSVRVTDLGVHRLAPDDGPAGRSWGYEAIGVLAGAGWLEKKAGKGEDAEPTLRLHDSGRGLIAAYDGTGGAGAAVARRLRDGTELTGAYVASRLARDLVEAWAGRRIEKGRAIDDPAQLADWMYRALQDEATTVPDTSGTMRGSLSRILPTTAAAVVFAPAPDGDGAMHADALWAGDSRAFLLSPGQGLQVLTIDDTRETDALALIRNDQPMTNLVSADKRFRLNHRAIETSGLSVLLVATDGCFGYVPTPAHFEFLLLDALVSAVSAADWSARIIAELGGFAADDVSFSFVVHGAEDFRALQAAFARRHDYLDQEHWLPFQAAAADPRERERLREASWAVYRETYEALIADGLAPRRR